MRFNVVVGARGICFWAESVQHDVAATAAHRNRGEKGNKQEFQSLNHTSFNFILLLIKTLMLLLDNLNIRIQDLGVNKTTYCRT